MKTEQMVISVKVEIADVLKQFIDNPDDYIIIKNLNTKIY